jgi:hypothetical protein
LFSVGEEHGHGEQERWDDACFAKTQEESNDEERSEAIARYVQQRDSTPVGRRVRQSFVGITAEKRLFVPG